MTLILAAALLVSFCSAAFADDFRPILGEVSSNNINIRTDATTGSEIICTAAKGEKVEADMELYEWYRIRLPKQAPAYVKKTFFECPGKEPPRPAKNSSGETPCLSAKATGNNVNIRLRPAENSPILGKIRAEETVKILSEEGDWFKIEPPLNSFGWIHKKFVNRLPEAPAPETLQEQTPKTKKKRQ